MINIDDGDYVICDGAWKNVGPPFLARFTNRANFTAAKSAFNHVSSEKRVICENYHGRQHSLLPTLDYFTQRLDKLEVWIQHDLI